MAKRAKAEHEFDCLTFKQGDQTLCVFHCNAKTLWSITEVNQLDEEKGEGYQRNFSEARVSKISKFVNDGNFIPTSVLISFTHAKLSRDGKKLIVSDRKDAGWVIDGQHRLLGASRADIDIELPVVAFTGLDIDDQINCFVTINREAKGVSSSLYLELLRNLPKQSNPSADAKVRTVDLAQLLRVDDESPFFGKIVSTTSPKSGQLSLTNFVRKVQPFLKPSGGFLYTFNDELRCKILNNYYKALRQVFPAEFRHPQCLFYKTIGFGVMMGVFPIVWQLTSSSQQAFRVADISKTLQSIRHIELNDWRKLTGSGTESALTEQLRSQLMMQVSADSTSSLALDD